MKNITVMLVMLLFAAGAKGHLLDICPPDDDEEETCPDGMWLSPDHGCLPVLPIGGACSSPEDCSSRFSNSNPSNFICSSGTCGERACPSFAAPAGGHEYRLAGGDSTCLVGRIDVREQGAATWGQVCDDFWDDNNAAVVCRSVDLTGGTAIQSSAHWYSSGAVFHMDDVACTGTESDLLQCSFLGWNSHNCVNSEVASVACSAD